MPPKELRYLFRLQDFDITSKRPVGRIRFANETVHVHKMLLNIGANKDVLIELSPFY